MTARVACEHVTIARTPPTLVYSHEMPPRMCCDVYSLATAQWWLEQNLQRVRVVFFFCFWQELIQLRVVASTNNTPMRTQSFTKSPTSYRVQKLLQRASGNRGSQHYLSRCVERFRVFDSLAQQSFGGVERRVNLIALGGLPVNCFWPERGRKRRACVVA